MKYFSLVSITEASPCNKDKDDDKIKIILIEGGFFKGEPSEESGMDALKNYLESSVQVSVSGHANIESFTQSIRSAEPDISIEVYHNSEREDINNSMSNTPHMTLILRW